LYGVGFIAGSLSGSKGGSLARLQRRFLLGGFLMAAGIAASGLAPVLAVAVVTFVAAGYGNGVLLVYERLLIQEVVADTLMGRVFGVKDALASWAFALGFLLGPALLELIGTRETVVVAGSLGLLAWAASVVGLRSLRSAAMEPVGIRAPLLGGAGADGVPDAGAGEQRAHLIGRN
jgi:hypothetical protein